MYVSGKMIFEGDDHEYSYNNEECFGFMWKTCRLSKQRFNEVLDLEIIEYYTKGNIPSKDIELIQSIPVFNIFEFSNDIISIDATKYKADRVIFTLQFIRNICDHSATFHSVSAKYTPVVAFLLHHFALKENFNSESYISFQYDADSSVFNPRILTKPDFKRILEHTESNADQFSNQGTFNEQGGYLKSYMFKGKSYFESIGVNYKDFVSSGNLPWNASSMCHHSGTSPIGFNNYPEPYGRNSLGMMYAWKKHRPDYKTVSEFKHCSNLIDKKGTLEEVIDNFLGYVGVNPADYKL